jgi:hypothetical protein
MVMLSSACPGLRGRRLSVAALVAQGKSAGSRYGQELLLYVDRLRTRVPSELATSCARASV